MPSCFVLLWLARVRYVTEAGYGRAVAAYIIWYSAGEDRTVDFFYLSQLAFFSDVPRRRDMETFATRFICQSTTYMKGGKLRTKAHAVVFQTRTHVGGIPTHFPYSYVFPKPSSELQHPSFHGHTGSSSPVLKITPR